MFVYDLQQRTFVDLPGLNTNAAEERPTLSADGATLAYITRRDGVHNGSADVYLYDLVNQRAGYLYSGRLNSNGDEVEPTLDADARLLAFNGSARPDGQGLGDVYLFDLERDRLLDLPRFNSAFKEGEPALSPDGGFLAFFSERYAPDLGHLGNDIFLGELASGELLALPGLNSDYEDAGPALSANAEFVLFHSKRPGGMGGYDLYLYHRDSEDTTRYLVSAAYLEDGYVTGADGRPLAGATVRVTDGDGAPLGETVTDRSGNFTFTVPAGAVLPIAYVSPHGEVVVDAVGDDTYVPDFQAGNLKFSLVWVEDTIQSGMPSKIRFDVESETPKYNTFVKIYLVKLPSGSVDDLDVSNFTPDYTLTALNIDNLGHNGPGGTVTETQDADTVTTVDYLSEDNKKAHVEHSFMVPAQVEDGTYAAVFSIGRFDYHPEDDALQSEDSADVQDNYLAAPASVIVGQPTLPNLRILSAELNSNSFELPEQRPDDEGRPPFGAELVLNLEVESMAQDTGLPLDIVFSLNLDGQSYPLFIADNADTCPVKLGKQTYPVIDLFGVGYTFNAALTYAESSVTQDDGDVVSYPYAAAFDALDNTVNLNIFGNNFDILEVDAGADFNGDKILCSWFGYDVQVLGVSVYFESNYISNAFDFSGLDETTTYERADDSFRVHYYESEEDMAQDDVTDQDNYADVAPRLIETGSAIDFSLAGGGYLTSASGDSLTGNSSQIKDDFALRWTGNIGIDSTEEGVYLFTLEAEDNVRLWLGNTWLLEQWDGVERGVTTYREAVMMHEDSHALLLEYADTSSGDADGGDAKLTWTKTDAGVFNAQYFSSSDLSGTPSKGGTATSIDYSGTGSARWVGVFEFTESDYRAYPLVGGGIHKRKKIIKPSVHP